MAFFNSAVGVLQTLVVALGAGLGIRVFIIEHIKLRKPNHIDPFYQSIFGNCAVFIKLNGVNNIAAFDAVCFFALDIMKVFTDRLLQLGFADLQFAI